jgi:S1-C subfamily serine protease
VGAVVGIIGVLAALWMLLPSIASVSGWPARSTAGSLIARWVSRDLPTPPDALQVLRRVLQQDAPQVFAELGPGTARGPVPGTNPLSSTVTAGVIGSTVKVEGEACNRIFEGSGFAAATDLIVTNAHVVAGERDTEIQLRGTGPAIPVTVVGFDVRDDLAVLRVRALGLPPLTMASNPTTGESAAILGYPLDGSFKARAGRLGQTQQVNTQDAYGKGHVMRQITALRGVVKPGNSGGPLVDAQGEVLATVFAAITGTPRPGGFAIPNGVVSAVVAQARGRVGAVATGHCAE